MTEIDSSRYRFCQRRAATRSIWLRGNVKSFDIINPATSAVLDRAPDATVEDARQAIEKSVVAFASWKAKTAFERSAVLRKWYELILADEATLATMMTQEMGKPITESRGEVKYAAAFVEWYAEEAKRAYGDIVPTHAANKRLLVTRQPVGPVYAVTPWNFPAAMVTRKVAPALAAGCTVVLKPAEQSPLTAIRLEELWVKAGGPADVFQVVTTSNPAAFSDVFFDDARVRKLTFTGSTEVGIKLYAKAAQTVKRVSLELGGHAPFIIFDDADMPAAVAQSHGDEVSQCRSDVRVRESHLRARAHSVAVRQSVRGRGEGVARRRSDERCDADRPAGRSPGPRQGRRARGRRGVEGRAGAGRRSASATACISIPPSSLT